jgi:hypothetical protein
MLCLLATTLLVGCAPKLQRPDVPPSRTLDPPLATGAVAPVADAADAISVYLASVQSRVGRRLIHAGAGGEVSRDPVWSWSASPDRYLDTALHLAAAANPRLRVVERANASTLTATVLNLRIEPSADGRRLAATVEARLTAPDGTVTSRILHAEETISDDLPGNAADALARLTHRLARECLSLVR